MRTLNQILNEELNLYLTTWNYHWNVEGAQFAALHDLFAQQYGALQPLIDELAERIRALGGRPETDVVVRIDGARSAPQMLAALAEAHESLSRKLRQEAIPEFESSGDPGTVDLLTRAVQLHDKAAWMLRASAR
ncbi:MAG: DNA starvation/stationary phase protection protein [Bryobacteraceae bacterium]|nr:DNA starvation/stationary phase protection protein [Bryobacteraceae bacterium]